MNADVTLLIPGLLPGKNQPHSLEKYPAVNRIVAASTQSQVKTEGLESAVLNWFHGPSAPERNSAAMLGFNLDYTNTANTTFCLRADPVFQQLDINGAILADSTILDITETEASAIISDLNHHFEDDGLAFCSVEPSRWYCTFPSALNISSVPPSQAIGKSVSLNMVRGEDAGVWRGWLSEIEMLLYSHRVNTERAASGKAAINTVWLWGEGEVEQLSPVTLALNEIVVFSDHFYVRSICNHHRIDCKSLENVHFDVTASSILLVDDRLSSALATGDSARYETELGCLERGTFAKLEHHLKSGVALKCVIWVGDNCWLDLSVTTAAERFIGFFSSLFNRSS